MNDDQAEKELDDTMAKHIAIAFWIFFFLICFMLACAYAWKKSWPEAIWWLVMAIFWEEKI